MEGKKRIKLYLEPGHQCCPMVGGVLVKRLELHLKQAFHSDICYVNTRNVTFPTLSCTLDLLYCRVEKLWLCCNLLHLLTKAILDFHENLTDKDHVLAYVVDVVGVSKDEVDVELPSLLLPRQLDVHPRL